MSDFIFECRTDELIQRAIRQKFKECTVLTVAHRLRTVIDSDRIMVRYLPFVFFSDNSKKFHRIDCF